MSVTDSGSVCEVAGSVCTRFKKQYLPYLDLLQEQYIHKNKKIDKKIKIMEGDFLTKRDEINAMPTLLK